MRREFENIWGRSLWGNELADVFMGIQGFFLCDENSLGGDVRSSRRWGQDGGKGNKEMMNGSAMGIPFWVPQMHT